MTYTLKTLATFTGTDGSDPQAGLLIDSDGNLYGTTSEGGSTGYGTVFEVVKSTGALQTLVNFGVTAGAVPKGDLIADGDGNLYGTTSADGGGNDGIVFEIVKSTGALVRLATFNYNNGAIPLSGLIADSDGNLFGTTGYGGFSDQGTVFELVKSTGELQTLATFNGTNGANPYGGLIADSAGNLYGTTSHGGASDYGTVFEIVHSTGTLLTLASFSGTNGLYPQDGLIADSDGNLYGTTSGYDPSDTAASGDGTVFELVKSTGALQTLATFSGATAARPYAALIADSAGNLYGTTAFGEDGGAVFEIVKSTGALQTLATFDGTNGADPSGLIFDSAGNLYGTTQDGGPSEQGTVFELEVDSSSVAPTITGTVASQSTTSEAPIAPFSTVTVSDPNEGGASVDALTITQTGPGTLSGSGLVAGPNGTYTLTGTAAAITASLDRLVFTPVNGVPNTAVATSFTLQVADAAAGTTSARSAAVTVTDSDPAVAPTITGTVASQSTTSEAPVTPFSTVMVSDRNNAGASEDTLTITVGGSGGTLSGNGLTSTGNGTYTLAGSAAAVTNALKALSFKPDTAGTATLSLRDVSSASTTPATASVSITDTAASASPVAPTGLADAMVAGGFVDAANDTDSQALSGTAAAGSTVTVYDRTTAIGTTVATAAGGFSYTLGHLADGSHNLTATATDAAGRTSAASAALSFIVDTVAPAAPGIALAHDTGASASDGITADPTIVFTPSATGDTLLYKVDGATDYATTAPVFATNGTADGPHIVSVEQKDPAGNISTPASLSFTLDSVAPVLAITAPASGGAVAIIDPTIAGTVDSAAAGSTVMLTNGTAVLGRATVASDGTWSTALALGADGSYAVTASDTDLAGNTGRASVTFTIDSTVNKDLFGSTTYDATSAAGQIYALYRTILGRAPDPTGFENYVTALNSGTSLTAIAQAMLDSPEYTTDYGAVGQNSNQASITQFYVNGLSRAPDPGGLQSDEDALNGGSQSLAQVAVGIATSPEIRSDLAATFQAGVFVPNKADTDIERLYYGLLDRSPDAAGLQSWEQIFAAGTGLDEIAQAFLGSTEYQATAIGQSNTQFIKQLYQSALGRTADPAGLQSYEKALDEGSISRAGTVSSVLESAEFTAATAGESTAAYINSIYEIALGRAADPTGLQTFEAAFADGLSRTAFDKTIVGSPEFQSTVTEPAQKEFITALYAGALDRSPDPGGLQSYMNQLASGASLASVALNIIQSPEAQNHLSAKIESGFHLG